MKNDTETRLPGKTPYSAPEIEVFLFTDADIVRTSEPYVDPDAAEWD